MSPLPGAAVVTKYRFDIWQSQEWLGYLRRNKVEGLLIAGLELRCCVLYAVLGADERFHRVTALVA